MEYDVMAGVAVCEAIVAGMGSIIWARCDVACLQSEVVRVVHVEAVGGHETEDSKRDETITVGNGCPDG